MFVENKITVVKIPMLLFMRRCKTLEEVITGTACIMNPHFLIFLVVSIVDEPRVPLRLKISKKQTAKLTHQKCKVTLTDHDFPVGEKHKRIPSVYAVCLKKDDEVRYNGPTFISIRSGKHDKSFVETHSNDFERILQLEEFQDAALTPNKDVKSLVFVLVDGRPDEAPEN